MRSIYFARRVVIMALTVSFLLLLLVWSNIDLGFGNISPKGIPVVVKNKLCSVNYDDDRIFVSNKSDLKVIYFVTPTYPRPEQIPELTRLSHTLMHVPGIHWIVADDQPVCSEEVLTVLKRSKLPFTHISSPKPYKYKITNFPRGVSNRRAAISWILDNVKSGVLYFGDDDNTVDLQLFEEIRNTRKVSMFPVGLISGYGVSSPIVSNGKVVGFFESWPGSRMFPVDMAGFAVNIEALTPKATMPYVAGHEEDQFLISLGLNVQDIQPLADNCSKVLVWHTKTVKYKKPTLKLNLAKVSQKPEFSSFANLLKETSKMNMAAIDPKEGATPSIISNGKTQHYDVFIGL